jgi:hypothetical protein
MANTTWSATDKTAGVTLSGTNNVVATTSPSGLQSVRSIDRNITGKFYWEITLTTIPGVFSTGLCPAATSLTTSLLNVGNLAIVVQVSGSGAIDLNGASVGNVGATPAAGNTLCFATDVGAQLFWVRLGAAGNWNGVAANNPATAVGGASFAGFIGAAVPLYAIVQSNAAASVFTANFGDTAFTGTVPSGFTAGFTAGASPPVNELVTQIGVEEWGAGTPAMQLTQAAVEEWAAVTTGNVQMDVTQIALEQWASVAFRVPGKPRQMLIM